jgi:SRSO17 transposase
VLGEAGFVEKGTKAAGVQRQHSGTAGRVGNCQIGAFLAHASPGGRALVGRAPCPPERRAEGRERRRRAGVPEPVGFTTEPELGRTMPGRAVAAGVPCAFAAGDSVYGADHALRRSVGKRGRGHVPAVPGAQRPGSKPAADRLGDVPARARQRLSAGDGAGGPRPYDRAHLPCRSDTAAGREEGLLVRRKVAEPDGFTPCLTLAPEATTPSDPVRVAGSRWAVEACLEAAEGGAGLDEHEVRSRTGRHRRIALAVPAHAHRTVMRQAAIGGRARRGPAGGALAPRRARGAPPPPAPRIGAPARSRAHPRLVDPAPTTPAARTTLPLEPTDQSP